MSRKERKKKRSAIGFIWILLIVLLVVVFFRGNFHHDMGDIIPPFFEFGIAEYEESDWNLVLVNPENKLPRNWDIEFTKLRNGQQIDSRIYPDLQAMFDDMRAEGIYPMVASGYRSAKQQREQMDQKVAYFIAQGYSRSDAKDEALKWVAEVGYSEHQTGLAVDINADGVHSTGTQVYEWLAQNAWRYGFVLRYPADKVDITGTDYEPWHYRYVGYDAAREIHENGMCLEEYLER